MATLAQASRPGGAAVATDVVGADRGDIEQPSRRAYEEEMPGLQSRVNELTEACRIQGAQLRDLNTVLAASLQTMNANVVLAAEKFSQAIGEASQLHERMLTSKAPDSSRVREGDVAAGAGSFDEKAPWCEEKKCILRDLCDSVDSCKFFLDDIKYFQSVPLPRTWRPELTLVPQHWMSGLPGLENLARQAVEMLMKYFIGCFYQARKSFRQQEILSDCSLICLDEIHGSVLRSTDEVDTTLWSISVGGKNK